MSLFQRLFGTGQKTTKEVAKDRLRFVLMSDRTAIPAAKMEELRRDLLEVLSRYVEIDEASLEVELERQPEGQVALVANIPIRRVRA